MVNNVFKKRNLPPMLFTDEDFQEIDPEHDDPMVITVDCGVCRDEDSC